MRRRQTMLRSLAIAAALCVAAAGCGTSAPPRNVGLLVVTLDAPVSAPADLRVMLHISAPGLVRHLALTPRQRQFTLETEIGGDYELAVESVEQQARIGQLVAGLRRLLSSGRGQPDDQQADEIVAGLGELSATVAQLEDAGVGSCSGHVDPGTRAAATVTWNADGLSETCGSN